MQPKVVVLTVVAVLVLAGCDATAPDPAKVLDASGLTWREETITYKTNEKNVPWTTSETNPCNNDIVSVTGLSNFKISTAFKDDGTFKYSANIVSKGTGNGTPSLKAYKVDEHFKFAEQVDGDTQGYVIKSLDKWDVDGPTRADSYKRYTRFKVQVDRDGEPKAEIDTSYVRCEQ